MCYLSINLGNTLSKSHDLDFNSKNNFSISLNQIELRVFLNTSQLSDLILICLTLRLEVTTVKWFRSNISTFWKAFAKRSDLTRQNILIDEKVLTRAGGLDPKLSDFLKLKGQIITIFASVYLKEAHCECNIRINDQRATFLLEN